MKLMKQVEYVVDNENQVDSWQEVTLVYSAALKQINTKLEILNDEFQHVHRYNPIEHIKSRMKTSKHSKEAEKVRLRIHNREYGKVHQRHCRNTRDMLFYV